MNHGADQFLLRFEGSYNSDRSLKMPINYEISELCHDGTCLLLILRAGAIWPNSAADHLMPLDTQPLPARSSQIYIAGRDAKRLIVELAVRELNDVRVAAMVV